MAFKARQKQFVDYGLWHQNTSLPLLGTHEVRALGAALPVPFCHCCLAVHGVAALYPKEDAHNPAPLPWGSVTVEPQLRRLIQVRVGLLPGI